MSKQYELEEVTIKDGGYVSKKDHSPISGSMVSRHKNGAVYEETFVESGTPTGRTKTYTPSGHVVSDTGGSSSALKSKEGEVTYQSVSAQYRQHKQKNLEMLPYFGMGFIGLIIFIMLATKIVGVVKGK